MTVVTVYAVFADTEEAARIARAAVGEELAACVNILGPVRSIYRWEGKLEDSAEVAALYKTTAAVADRLIARIAELHSYDVPCIECWAVDTLWRDYGDWVESTAR